MATIGIIVFVCMILAVFLGIPIYIAVIAASCAGLYLVGGPAIMIEQFSTGIFTNSASYTFSVIPLFLAVGVLAGETGIAEGIFVSARKWLGRFRGGLLYTVVGANAVFGACSGVSAAGTVVFTKVAHPALKGAGYDEALSLGCITASGCLSALIPPSIGILQVCLLSDISIGTALLTGLNGGIVMALVMFAVIFGISKLQSGKVPAVTEDDLHVSWKDRLSSLKLLIPVLALFALIVGGSFFGWFPPAVGGGVAFVIIVIYALMKRMSVKTLFLSIWDGVISFSGIFLIVLASQIFGRFIAITGLANAIVDFITGVGFPPIVVMFLVAIFYLLCGCVMDAMSIIMITIPIVFPVLTSLGYNGFAICILLVFLAEAGSITPPFGVSVFTVASVTGESPSKIFRGCTPFLIAYFICVVLIILFPNLILIIPKLMGAAL